MFVSGDAQLVQAAGVPALTPEVAEFVRLRALLVLGDPRPIIERYFKIEPEGGNPPLVPMLLANEPNQEYYWRELFGNRMDAYNRAAERGISHEDACAMTDIGFPWQVNVLTFKDRKARWSSAMFAFLAAKMFWIPGTHIYCLVNAEDTFSAVNRFLRGFYDNLPQGIKPEIKGGKWAEEHNVILFPMPDGGMVTSSFTIRTAANPNAGTAETPTDVAFDEYPKFPKTFSKASQSSVRAAMPTTASFWRGGTAGPDGADCTMYEEIQQIKKGERQAKYLFRTWFQNPANILKPGHKDRRPADRNDDDIKPDVNAGVNGDKEVLLVSQFPGDGIPVAWRLAWRRAKMADAMLAAGGPGNDDAAAIFFQREHCEDDETPWMIAGRSQFNPKRLAANISVATARENIAVIDTTIEGLHWICWRDYNPEHVYEGVMDLGGGGINADATTLQLYDVTASCFIGELYGDKTEPYTAAAAAVTVMTHFGMGILVVERNRFPGIGNYIRKKLGYRNIWKRPMRAGEKPEVYWQEDYGMYVGSTSHGDNEPSEEELLGTFKADFNNGSFNALNPNLLKTMQAWNPDTQSHCPDRIAAARLRRLGLQMAWALSPVTGMRPPVSAVPSVRVVQPERHSLYVAGR